MFGILGFFPCFCVPFVFGCARCCARLCLPFFVLVHSVFSSCAVLFQFLFSSCSVLVQFVSGARTRDPAALLRRTGWGSCTTPALRSFKRPALFVLGSVGGGGSGGGGGRSREDEEEEEEEGGGGGGRRDEELRRDEREELEDPINNMP